MREMHKYQFEKWRKFLIFSSEPFLCLCVRVFSFECRCRISPLEIMLGMVSWRPGIRIRHPTRTNYQTTYWRTKSEDSQQIGNHSWPYISIHCRKECPQGAWTIQRCPPRRPRQGLTPLQGVTAVPVVAVLHLTTLLVMIAGPAFPWASTQRQRSSSSPL